jgi:hypothetical protein
MRGRLKPSGAASTLAEVFADLKLRPLSSAKEHNLRGQLQSLIGRWTLEIADFQEPRKKLRVKDARATLKIMVVELENIERILSSTGEGLIDFQENGAVSLLAKMLGENPEIKGIPAARLFLHDFKTRLETIAHASRIVIHELERSKGKPGAPRFDWYRDFADLVRAIAVENRIKPVVINNRRSSEPQGRFIELVEKFELLFPPRMRCTSNVARAKRLTRALGALAGS